MRGSTLDVRIWHLKSITAASRAGSNSERGSFQRNIMLLSAQRWTLFRCLCHWAKHFTIKCFTWLRWKWVPGRTEITKVYPGFTTVIIIIQKKNLDFFIFIYFFYIFFSVLFCGVLPFAFYRWLNDRFCNLLAFSISCSSDVFLKKIRARYYLVGNHTCCKYYYVNIFETTTR